MFKNKYILFIVISIIYGDFIKPVNNSNFYYTHILFEWEQIADAHSYNLSIENLTNNIDILNIVDSSPVCLEHNPLSIPLRCILDYSYILSNKYMDFFLSYLLLPFQTSCVLFYFILFDLI